MAEQPMPGQPLAEQLPSKIVAVHVSYRSRAMERGTLPLFTRLDRGAAGLADVPALLDAATWNVYVWSGASPETVTDVPETDFSCTSFPW